MQAARVGSGALVAPRRAGQWTPLARALAETGDRWTLLIALGLADGRRRQVQLQRGIAGLSGAVLDRHLRRMVAAGLVSRRRYREMPPRVELELTEPGRELLPIAGALARWGMRHAWSAPEPPEQVDLASLLELLPLLVDGAEGLPDGVLELIVAAAEQDERGTGASPPADSLPPLDAGARRLAGAGRPLVLCFAVEDGRLRMFEGGRTHRPDASVAGGRHDWLRTLGPERDPGGLRITGRRALAEAVFAALPETVAPNAGATQTTHNARAARETA